LFYSLSRFFTQHAAYQLLFNSFAQVPVEELATDKRLIVHALAVTNVFSNVLDNLHDHEFLTEILQKIGRKHHRGLSKEAFEVKVEMEFKAHHSQQLSETIKVIKNS